MSNDTDKIVPESTLTFTGPQMAAVAALRGFMRDYYNRISPGAGNNVDAEGPLNYGLVTQLKKILSEEGYYKGNVEDGVLDYGTLEQLNKYITETQSKDIAEANKRGSTTFRPPRLAPEAIDALKTVGEIKFHQRDENADFWLGFKDAYIRNAVFQGFKDGVDQKKIAEAKEGSNAVTQGEDMGAAYGNMTPFLGWFGVKGVIKFGGAVVRTVGEAFRGVKAEREGAQVLVSALEEQKRILEMTPEKLEEYIRNTSLQQQAIALSPAIQAANEQLAAARAAKEAADKKSVVGTIVSGIKASPGFVARWTWNGYLAGKGAVGVDQLITKAEPPIAPNVVDLRDVDKQYIQCLTEKKLDCKPPSGETYVPPLVTPKPPAKDGAPSPAAPSPH